MYSRAYIEITNISNRSCSFCPGTTRPLRRMSLSEFDTVTDRLLGVTEYLYYHVMGEPLTHPDLPDFIRLAKEKGFKSAITTNGTLLSRRGKELIDAGVYKVNISVHSFEDGEDSAAHGRYLDGILDFEIEQGNWTYTYHDRMVNYHGINQVEFVIDELRRNPYSRRAVIVIRDVDVDAGNADPACLQHIQYFVRDNKLHCKLMFRSNDACKATFMNAFALIMLQKKIADELGYEVGTYTHRANSFHCYAADFELLDSYVKRAAFDNATYNYVGEWDELMEEAKPEIAQMVEELRGR